MPINVDGKQVWLEGEKEKKTPTKPSENQPSELDSEKRKKGA